MALRVPRILELLGMLEVLDVPGVVGVSQVLEVLRVLGALGILVLPEVLGVLGTGMRCHFYFMPISISSTIYLAATSATAILVLQEKFLRITKQL